MNKILFTLEEYNSEKSSKYMEKLNIEDLYILQADGEVPELMRYFYYKNQHKSFKLGEKNYFRKAFGIQDENTNDIWTRFMMKSKCSAMIKLIKNDEGGVKDLLSGHNAWTDYSELYRTYKQ